VRETLFASGLAPPLVHYKTNLETALEAAKKHRHKD